MRLTLQSLADLPRIAQEVHTRLADYPVIALQGDLGAGKTTLVHGLCRLDGASEEEVVNSPTFAIVNVYTTQSDETIYHIDCYRLENLADADQIGLAEYIRSGARCYIEWPDVIAPLLPEDTAVIHIEAQPDGSRLLTLLTE